jgi:hypothetical protein
MASVSGPIRFYFFVKKKHIIFGKLMDKVLNWHRNCPSGARAIHCSLTSINVKL